MSEAVTVALFRMRKAAGWFDTPCGGCRECCRGDAVRILPHEDPSKWQTEPHPYKAGARMLAHVENGDCVYLGPAGCTIQDDKPQQCYTMDCRRVAAGTPKSAMRRLVSQGAMNPKVFARGLELLELHGPPQDSKTGRLSIKP